MGGVLNHMLALIVSTPSSNLKVIESILSFVDTMRFTPLSSTELPMAMGL